MNWTNVRLILAREIRDQLRDRRTLFMIAVLPILLYPLLGMSFLQIAQFMQEHPVSVLVVGAQNLPASPSLIEKGHFAARLFTEADHVRLLEVHFARQLQGDPRAEARREAGSGKYDAVVYFPADFARRLEQFRRLIATRSGRHLSGSPAASPKGVAAGSHVPKPDVFWSKASDKSQVASFRLDQVLERWREEVVRTTLAAGGIPAAAAQPFEWNTIDVATDNGAQVSPIWSKILPVMLLIWALTGAFYPAVDLCAGEKERGTLETLLSSPAQRSEIVLGKLLTIMLFSMITATLNLLSMGVTGWLILGRVQEFGAPPLSAALWLALALVPMSLMFSALCLALAAFARSSKEGQYYLMPLLLVTMPLVVLPMAPGVELNLGYSLIPVTGVVLILRATLDGHYLQALQFLPPVLAVTIGGSALAIRWAIDQFNSESVLFRESERLDVGLWIRHLLHDRQATPTVAGAVFGGVLILLIRFFLSFAAPAANDFRSFVVLMLVTQLAVVATPTLMLTLLFTNRPGQTLLLNRPAWWAIPAAVLLAVFVHPFANLLQQVVMQLYPIGGAMKKALSGMDGIFANTPFWQVLLVIAVVPAICEELAFRGFLLSGFRHLGHKWRAIIYTAIFFGLTHAILQQSIIACLVGIVIGYLAVQTRSLYPCIAFHVVHNAMAVVPTQIALTKLESSPVLRGILAPMSGGLASNWQVLVVCWFLALIILYGFYRLPWTPSEEEQRQEAILRAARADG